MGDQGPSTFSERTGKGARRSDSSTGLGGGKGVRVPFGRVSLSGSSKQRVSSKKRVILGKLMEMELASSKGIWIRGVLATESPRAIGC